MTAQDVVQKQKNDLKLKIYFKQFRIDKYANYNRNEIELMEMIDRDEDQEIMEMFKELGFR